MRWRIETQILAGFVLAVIVLAIVGTGLYRTTVGFVATSAALDRSQRAVTALETVYSLLNQAEARQRLWLLLGGDQELLTREQALRRIYGLLDELDTLTEDKSGLNARLPELRASIAARLGRLDAVLEAHRRDGAEAGRRQLAAGPGRAEMENVRAVVVAMQAELDGHIAARRQAVEHSANRTLSMLALLLMLVALALGALYARIRRETSERRASEERLHAVVANAGDGIVTIDSNGLIESFNPAAERLFGYAAAEVVGRNVSLLMPEPHRGRHDGYLERYLRGQGANLIGTVRELSARRKDGSEVPVGLSVGEMVLGGESHFTGVLHDLTQRRRSEARQNALIADLRTMNEELENFAYVVSHDLKAPLRGIGSLADWLLADYATALDDQGREYLSLMKNRVTRMDALIDGILEYSRVGRTEPSRAPVDLNVLLAQALQLLAPPPEVTVTVEGALPVVEGDATRLQQVLQNLIGNAIAHRHQPHCAIRVFATDQGERWRISVADNGPGIDPRHHERIFQLFQVLTPRDRKESTGVGLALVRKIVELHGGKVWVESRPGEGATFHFTLPKAAQPASRGEHRA